MSSDAVNSSYTIFEHPSIGQIRGIQRLEGVIDFLGVQYATLKDGYARGELKTLFPGDLLDATKHG